MTSMTFEALRLRPGEDLKKSLDRFVLERKLSAGCILACAGSLSQLVVRLAGGSDVVTVDGPLEIVSLTGTLSPDGSHLHVAVADGDGHVFGGHVKEVCRVHTTAEVVVGILPGIRFGRKFDPDTGFRELLITQSTEEVSDDQGK